MIGNWFMLEPTAILSLVAKSVTTPIAMIITEQLGGLITLITVLVLFTGIIGIIVAEPIFTFFNLQDERWQGLILGVSAHAIGTLKAFEKKSSMRGLFNYWYGSKRYLDDSLPHSSYARFWSMNDYAFMQKEVHLGNC